MSYCADCTTGISNYQELMRRYSLLRADAHRAFCEGRFESASRYYYNAMAQSRLLLVTPEVDTTGITYALEAAHNCINFANHLSAAGLNFQLKQSEQAMLMVVSGRSAKSIKTQALAAYTEISMQLSGHLARNDFSASAQAHRQQLCHVLHGVGAALRDIH